MLVVFAGLAWVNVGDYVSALNRRAEHYLGGNYFSRNVWVNRNGILRFDFAVGHDVAVKSFRLDDFCYDAEFSVAESAPRAFAGLGAFSFSRRAAFLLSKGECVGNQERGDRQKYD